MLWRGVAHRNETAVGLGGGPRPKNSAAVRAAVRPAEIGRPRPPRRISAKNLADTAGRWSGRPAESAGRTAGSFRYPPHPMCPLKNQSPPLRAFK